MFVFYNFKLNGNQKCLIYNFKLFDDIYRLYIFKRFDEVQN